MEIITGYKVKSEKLSEIETIMMIAKDKVANEAKRNYKLLLSREITNLVDNIALNVIQRPSNDMSILDLAINMLNERIAFASTTHTANEYDFSVFMYIMKDETDSNITYIKLSSCSPDFKKCLNRIDGLAPYSLTDKDVCLDNDRSEKWTQLHKMYEKYTPITVQLFTANEINWEIKPDTLAFFSPKDRAFVKARHNLTQKLLNQYGNNGQIPNFRFMEYLDEATSRLANEQYEDEFAHYQADLLKILPVIDEKLITSIPGAAN
ncbi:MAG: hypothetical protein GX903_11855 [Spirochaetales bacterium]|nr:hypothetical protein [Spirochaetales bacterium]